MVAVGRLYLDVIVFLARLRRTVVRCAVAYALPDVSSEAGAAVCVVGATALRWVAGYS